MIGISKINNTYLYDLARDYDNILGAVKECCSGDNHNPKILIIKENKE